jgi:hypothetical protein
MLPKGLRDEVLNDADHAALDRFLDRTLNEYKTGASTIVEARETIAHVIAAIDCGNLNEVNTFVHDNA